MKITFLITLFATLLCLDSLQVNAAPRYSAPRRTTTTTTTTRRVYKPTTVYTSTYRPVVSAYITPTYYSPTYYRAPSYSAYYSGPATRVSLGPVAGSIVAVIIILFVICWCMAVCAQSGEEVEVHHHGGEVIEETITTTTTTVEGPAPGVTYPAGYGPGMPPPSAPPGY